MIEQPTPPQEGECCESECSPCVWDTYYEEMALWRQAEAERKAREARDSEE
ncbi:hypothetical protein ADIMK_0449 [Marinobacterium lacunae]|uniref:Oxidoreductase-like domain-containing protein n=1 Tax=Marinobacterium lacunae TaxID=1232683 RepID=A0A081G3Y7_9GAMM|nr:oxidoreductase-like domain-containing protein [Marinobacterium lacunae]KEA65492.1 hypothetical protein ADIMK_0449 [Marinobacterium lacunae]MBR9883374.1 hypothetical protein [Oceanospirillales bacterium]